MLSLTWLHERTQIYEKEIYSVVLPVRQKISSQCFHFHQHKLVSKRFIPTSSYLKSTLQKGQGMPVRGCSRQTNCRYRNLLYVRASRETAGHRLVQACCLRWIALVSNVSWSFLDDFLIVSSGNRCTAQSRHRMMHNWHGFLITQATMRYHWKSYLEDKAYRHLTMCSFRFSSESLVSSWAKLKHKPTYNSINDTKTAKFILR